MLRASTAAGIAGQTPSLVNVWAARSRFIAGWHGAGPVETKGGDGEVKWSERERERASERGLDGLDGI